MLVFVAYSLWMNEFTYPCKEDQIVVRMPSSDADHSRAREDPQHDGDASECIESPCLDESLFQRIHRHGFGM